jgi:glutamine synthetase
MRIPNGDGAARRIEHRIAGADANPYLSLAVILAGILHGIDNELKAQPPTTAGPKKADAVLPATWEAALKPFEDSTFIQEYLGADLQQALAEIKRVEQAEFSAAVSALEYDTYLVLA